MRIPLVLALAASAASAASVACGADGATGVAAPTSLEGLWLLNYSLTQPQYGVSCVGGGQVVLEPTEAGFTGSSSSFSRRCVSARDTTMVWETVTISDGQRSGASISFTDGRWCAFTGTIRNGLNERLAGSVVCSPNDLSPVYSGSWTAMRPLPD